MSIQRVKAYFAQLGMAQRVREFEVSSATVSLAAEAVGVIPARIAKTLSFRTKEGCLLVVTAGDMKIDNSKFKATFGMKAAMLTGEEVTTLLDQTIGGVCPFAIDPGIAVYLDGSLRRFDTVFPACGSTNSAIELTCDELFACANARDWVDVCKGMESMA